MINPMLRDQALLEFANENFSKEEYLLYFYTWEKRAISLGKIQRNINKIIEEAHTKEIPVLKRPSGGKAVIHGNDVCFTFIAKQSNTDFGGSLLESYSKVMNFILNFLNDFFKNNYNWEAKIKLKNNSKTCSDTQKKEKIRNQANCFNVSINCEGIIENETKEYKILGAAQTMYANSFLQQGSLIVNNNSQVRKEAKLSFEEDFKSMTDIYNNGVNININELCFKLNTYQGINLL